jgi:3-deoxy-manno-octulosonate cytidylyltransferase (CMP-KDO synthetase)
MDRATRIAIVIPARIQSTRLPRKLLLHAAGRTILERTWSRANRASGICGVWIATDSDEIASEARLFGARVIMTGPQSSGTDRVAAALAHIRPAPYAVINVQGDEPQIDRRAIERVADELRAGAGAIVTCGSPLTSDEDRCDPAVVKVLLGEGDRAIYFSRACVPGNARGESASLPPRVARRVLRHIGIYGYPVDLLRRFVELPCSPLEEAESLEQLRAISAFIPIRVVRLRSAPRPVDTAADLAALRSALARRSKRAHSTSVRSRGRRAVQSGRR